MIRPMGAVARLRQLLAASAGALVILGALHCGKASPCSIEATSYDRSCTTDNDCVGVPSGNLCEASCTNCTGAAINTSAQQQYQTDLSKLADTTKDCPCIYAQVYCNQGTCSLTSPADAGP